MRTVGQYIYAFFNFLDLNTALERILTYGVDRLRVNTFTLLLRSFDNIIGYTLAYLIIKSIQFVLSLLLEISIEEIPFFYLSFPILLLLEIGLSKLFFGKLVNFTMFLCRSLIKFGILYSIDKLMVYLFS